MMTDFRLKVFCCVARHLSFTKASKELLVSQPAISKHIQELEAEYGTLLFERKNSGISLTTAGVLLLNHAESILNRYRQLDFEMNLLSSYSEEVLRLGVSPMISQQILPYYLSFQKRAKPLELSLLCCSSQAIKAAIKKGEIELGIIEDSLQEPDLHYTPFRLNEFLRVIGCPTVERCSCQQEFYFVQKLDAPHDSMASAFLHYIIHNL